MRHLVTRCAKSCKTDITREQLDLFSLKVLATVCISVANASARTAVLIAFGKANLVRILLVSAELFQGNQNSRCSNLDSLKFRLQYRNLKTHKIFVIKQSLQILLSCDAKLSGFSDIVILKANWNSHIGLYFLAAKEFNNLPLQARKIKSRLLFRQFLDKHFNDI